MTQLKLSIRTRQNNIDKIIDRSCITGITDKLLALPRWTNAFAASTDDNVTAKH